MIIYIETFLIQNILINFCLLRLTELTTKPQTTIFKMIIASTIGAFFSVISAIYINNILIMNLLKFICSTFMILIAFKNNFKQFIFNYLLLFLYTYAFFGAITTLSGTSYSTSFGLVLSSKFSLEMICCFIVILTYIFQLITNHLKYKFKTSKCIYKIEIQDNSKTISLNAFLDTGNLLNLNGEPVVVLDINTFLKLKQINLIDFYLLKSETISTNTVTTNSNLKIFKIDQLKIFDKHITTLKNTYIAVSNTNFKNQNYQALLSPMHL